MTMKALVQGAGSVAFFGRSTDTIPDGLLNYEMLLFDTGKIYTGTGVGTGMSSWLENSNISYVSSPLMVAAVAISGAWADLTGKPSTLPPSTQTHAIADTTGLQTVIDGKAAASHNHAASDVNSGALADARIPALAISKITGLQTAIDAKFTTPTGTAAQYLRGDGTVATFPTIPSLVIGAPVARTIAVNTAYQASTPAKPAFVTLNITSTAALSLSGGTTITADLVIGATNAVASGTGTVLGKAANTLTGTLVVGLAISTTAATPINFPLPAGYYWAIRNTSGTVTVTSCFDSALG